MTSQEQREAFERAIEQNPSDYEQRRIFADWLEEMDEPEEAERQRQYEAAEKWLMHFSSQCGRICLNYNGAADQWRDITYQDVVEAGNNYADREEYFVQQGDEQACDLMLNGNSQLFWENWSVVTGRPIPTLDDDECRSIAPFDCSC